MIGVALLVVGVLLVMCSARGLETPATPRDDSRWFDALLFLLCLAGVIAARRKPDDDESPY